jgi:2-oxoglutarate ferredoxin oxidoreductase subunit alpha
MAEGLNMAYAMELPMLLILTQRLGPSTGSATTGAQGDLMFLNGVISGHYPIPVFSHSDFEDAWDITYEAIKTAMKFRTPVILLTSKELVMTNKSFDLNRLKEITPVEKFSAPIVEPYEPYKTGKEMVPPYIALGNDVHKVRINSSTHNNAGLIKKNDPESMANTKRLKDKFEKRIDEFTFYDLDEQKGATKLIVSYGISADAAKDAVKELRNTGEEISLLIVKTMIPVPPKVTEIIDDYKEVIFVEESMSGIYSEIIYGKIRPSKVRSVNKIGSLISPSEIIKLVKS